MDGREKERDEDQTWVEEGIFGLGTAGDDPRVGCLAVPICIVAGFIVGALIAAAFGVSAGWSSTIGLIVGGIGAVVAVVVLRRDT